MTERNVPVLETPRAILTLPEPADADELLAYLERNREHLRPWSPPEPPGAPTRGSVLRRIDNIHAEFRVGSSVRLWIYPRDTRAPRLIGAVSLANIVLGAFRACYLGYQLDHAFQGRGLMHDALTASVRYAFEELRLHRIMANYVPTNERSGRVLRRLGFAVEGYAREYLFVGGQFRDHILTSLINQNLRDAETLCTPGA